MSRTPEDDPLLGLVVDLCNTYDLLNDPPDRLTLAFLPSLADHYGRPDLGRGFHERHLEPVRAVRDRLYGVFATSTVEEKVDVLNGLLADHAAAARLVHTDGAPRLAATGGGDPVARLAVACADALARAVATGGADRMRTCVGDPCRCVYVDRTKANRQRYCCELCNDRMASAAYRRRRGS